MSTFTKEMMVDLADKLLIGLADDEIDLLLEEFDVIKENMDIIASIPGIETVEPKHFPTDYVIESLREDKAEESLDIKDILKNCGGQIDRMVEVPKVVGE